MSHKLLSDQKQRFFFPLGAWFTACTISGAGTVTHLAFDFDTQTLGIPPNQIQMRITANGASVPQIGGMDGLQLQNFFGPGLNSTSMFETESLEVSANDSQFWGSFWRRPIPFQDGLKIELYLPGTSSVPVKGWYTVEYISDDPGYVLHGDFVRNDVLPNAESTILDTTGVGNWTKLLGLWQRLTPLSAPTPADWRDLEGDFRIYYDGETTASYRNPGTEDFFGSSHYYRNGLVQKERIGRTVINSTTGQVAAYRFFDTENVQADNGLKLTWCNGESDVLSPSYTTRCGCTVFYYQLT